MVVDANSMFNKAARTTLDFHVPTLRLLQLLHRENVVKQGYQQEAQGYTCVVAVVRRRAWSHGCCCCSLLLLGGSACVRLTQPR